MNWATTSPASSPLSTPRNGTCSGTRSSPVVAANAELIAAARAAGLPVLYARHVFRADPLDVPARVVGLLPDEPKPLVRGSWDADVIDELKPAEGGRIMDENRYGAFLYTDLELVLRAMGVRRLLVTGVVISVTRTASDNRCAFRSFHRSGRAGAARIARGLATGCMLGTA
jgi:nicotinamidase-related amidase